MKPQLHFPIVAIIAASLACSIDVGGPTLPDPPIVSSAEVLQQLQTEIESALLRGLSDGILSLSLTQEQLTAFLAARLSAGEEPLIRNAQVVLGDQEMIVYGRARAGIFEANAAVTVEFAVDDLGKPQIKITHAELGPLPMPDGLKDAIASAVDEALTGYLGPAAIGFRLESINISGGAMTFTGRLR